MCRAMATNVGVWESGATCGSLRYADTGFPSIVPASILAAHGLFENRFRLERLNRAQDFRLFVVEPWASKEIGGSIAHSVIS